MEPAGGTRFIRWENKQNAATATEQSAGKAEQKSLRTQPLRPLCPFSLLTGSRVVVVIERESVESRS